MKKKMSKIYSIILSASLLAGVLAGCGSTPLAVRDGYAMPMRLLYDSPTDCSDDYEQSIPVTIGNGYERVRVFSGFYKDEYILGSAIPREDGSPSKKFLPMMTAQISFPTAEDSDCEDADKFIRWLNVDNATAGSKYTLDDITYRAECFASLPSRVVCMKYGTTRKKSVSLRLIITDTPIGSEFNISGSTISCSGVDPASGQPYCGQFTVSADGGSISTGDGLGLTVDNADSVTIYYTSAVGSDAVRLTENASGMAMRAGYAKLREEHVDTYTELYSGVYLDIGGCYSNTPTNELIEAYRSHSHYASYERYLETLFFQYGRYLTISMLGRDAAATDATVAGMELARLADDGDGDGAWETLDSMISENTQGEWDGGVIYYDGSAGMQEMLMQSSSGYIQLLPALPFIWNNGIFEGMKAEEGFTVSAYWENGRVYKAVIHSEEGGDCSVELTDVTVSCDGKPVDAVRIGDFITFPTEKGKSYVITPAEDKQGSSVENG